MEQGKTAEGISRLEKLRKFCVHLISNSSRNMVADYDKRVYICRAKSEEQPWQVMQVQSTDSRPKVLHEPAR